MALTPRRHGVNIVEVTTQRRPIVLAATSIWAVICTAPAADEEAFPLDTPVMVADLETAILDAGAGGTLRDTLRAISDQGQTVGLVVRVGEGEGEDPEDLAADQVAKVIGAPGAESRTGMQTLLDAETLTGLKPRILAAPGLDGAEVAAALAVLAGKLRAFAYVAAQGESIAEVVTYRETFSSRELMMIHGDFEVGEDLSPATARAVGLRAALDNAQGYHKSISNVPVQGVTGLSTSVTFDLQSEQTEMGVLNGADVTGLIRRRGLRFWGNRTLASEPNFAFEVAVRTNQVLRESIAEGVFPFIDQPLTRGLALDLVESINAMGRTEVRAGRLIGFEAYLADGNTPDQLAQGKLRIGYRFTPVPPLEDLTVETVITDEFFADFATQTIAA